MEEILPPRPLNDDEVDVIKQSEGIENFECVYERDGCVSFIVITEDTGLSYQWNFFESEWDTVVLGDGDFDKQKLYIEHVEAVAPLVERMFEIDVEEGKTWPYMENLSV
jgi:hypothetical protein